jgi:hypothetical protein
MKFVAECLSRAPASSAPLRLFANGDMMQALRVLNAKVRR